MHQPGQQPGPSGVIGKFRAARDPPEQSIAHQSGQGRADDDMHRTRIDPQRPLGKPVDRMRPAPHEQDGERGQPMQPDRAPVIVGLGRSGGVHGGFLQLRAAGAGRAM